MYACNVNSHTNCISWRFWLWVGSISVIQCCVSVHNQAGALLSQAGSAEYLFTRGPQYSVDRKCKWAGCAIELSSWISQVSYVMLMTERSCCWMMFLLENRYFLTVFSVVFEVKSAFFPVKDPISIPTICSFGPVLCVGIWNNLSGHYGS